KDECSRLLDASTMKSRRGFAIQRLMNAMRQAHAVGWFIVFDTLTLADERSEAFYDNPNALRDYFRDIGRMVLAAERSEERFSRNAETELVCRLLLEKKTIKAPKPRPATAQWEIFLRNHDEVDLGRLHEKQRQILCKSYG